MEYFRVLKKDGSMWIIIGDSYAGSGRGTGDVNKKGIQQKASYVSEFCKPYKLSEYKTVGIELNLEYVRMRRNG